MRDPAVVADRAPAPRAPAPASSPPPPPAGGPTLADEPPPAPRDATGLRTGGAEPPRLPPVPGPWYPAPRRRAPAGTRVRAEIAQLVEHATENRGVASSNLALGTNTQVGHRAEVAQLVEHHLAKVRVAGSSPVFRSTPPASRTLVRGALPLRLVVGQRTLDPLAEVRILEGQPPFPRRPARVPRARVPTRPCGARPDPVGRSRHAASVPGILSLALDAATWRSGPTRGSAKPLFVGSNPTVASTFHAETTGRSAARWSSARESASSTGSVRRPSRIGR